MSPKSNLKEHLAVESKNGAFFSGGKLICTDEGDTLYCTSFGAVNVIDVEQGRPRFVLGDASEDSDLVHCFTVASDDRLITAHKSGLFKCWQISDGQLLKQWKYIHKGTVAALDISGDLLVSGGSDSVIRVWNIRYHTCNVALRGSTGVVSLVKFHSDNDRKVIFSSADDLKIKCWDLEQGATIYELSGHYSKITCIAFHQGGKYLVSCGRDKVVMLWDLEKRASVKTFPAFESLEGVVCLERKFELPVEHKINENGVYVAIAGEKGAIRIIEMVVGQEVYAQTNSLVSKAEQDGGLSITQLIYNKVKNCFVVATVDHNIIFHELNTFNCVKQLVGFTDEILDVVFVGPEDSHFAVATNSTDIKLYNVKSMGCQLLKGHTDLVLSLATSLANKSWMLSSGKDNSVRLWSLDAETDTMTCLASGTRHTALVSSVAFGQMSSDFFVSASKDATLKLWTVKQSKNPSPKASAWEMAVKFTEVAHEKEINSVAVSPNDKLVATASQDKTVKLWLADGLAHVGTLRGHRRGVWCVRFSPVDQVILTCSADTTLKIWSVAQHACLKTFEGHDSSVLSAEFLSKGMQIASVSGDGLLKLWTIKDSECVATFEEHSGKIWALAVSTDEERFLTGGTDSLLISWRDATEEKREAAFKAAEEMRSKEQLLSNLLQHNQLLPALSLALSLDKPFRVLNIVKDILKVGDRDVLAKAVAQLAIADKERLVKCVATWNTNSRNCEAAQTVASVLLDEIVSGSLAIGNLRECVEQLLPYTERHFKRLTGLLEDVHYLAYTLSLMKPTLK